MLPGRRLTDNTLARLAEKLLVLTAPETASSKSTLKVMSWRVTAAAVLSLTLTTLGARVSTLKPLEFDARLLGPSPLKRPAATCTWVLESMPVRTALYCRPEPEKLLRLPGPLTVTSSAVKLLLSCESMKRSVVLTDALPASCALKEDCSAVTTIDGARLCLATATRFDSRLGLPALSVKRPAPTATSVAAFASPGVSRA